VAVSSLSDRAPLPHAQPVTVGFAGLTHIGIVAALAAAARGARVVAFDTDMTLVARLKRDELPVVAPALTRQALSDPARLDYTATAADLSQCDVIYICPDVPANEKGRSDLTAVQSLLDDAWTAARPEAVLVVLSPVPPGFCRSQMRKGRTLFYQLAPLLFDESAERAAEPARLVVGCADPGAPLPASFRGFLERFGCPILPMRYESAELARLSYSLLRVTRGSAQSTVAALCEKAGGDCSELASAFAPEKISATPVGIAAAAELERDLAMLRRFAEAHDGDTSAVEAGLKVIRQQRNWVLQCLEENVFKRLPDAQLAILGLATRPGTTSTDDSPALALLASLPKLRVRVYDPAVTADPSWHAQLEAAPDALDACRQADAVIIMTAWPEFASLDPEALARVMRGKALIDPNRALAPDAVRRAGLEHYVPA